MRQVILLITILITLISCNKGDNSTTIADKPSEQKTVNLTVDGNARSFIVYLPTGYNNAGKMPLIFAIHGGSGTPEGMINIANFKTIADRDKVVLVYPAGIQNNWNDGRPTTPNQLGINDVSFFNQMCDYMINNYSVDGTKIYATGISNGGFMSSRLGCELSNRIAAIAVDAASIEATTIAPNCKGTAISHFQAIDKWITINGCNTTPTITDLPDIANDGTTIKQRVYSNSTNGSEVVSYVILNGGHTWPQGYQYLNEAIIGKTSQDMNACEVIWTFFKRFKRQ
ncbi:MAG: hypothetical protein NT021_01710 [Sphingobacteriales bacterium]|nr:hypothetical protein [Sphingobacteriales bacterium]